MTDLYAVQNSNQHLFGVSNMISSAESCFGWIHSVYIFRSQNTWLSKSVEFVVPMGHVPRQHWFCVLGEYQHLFISTKTPARVLYRGGYRTLRCWSDTILYGMNTYIQYPLYAIYVVYEHILTCFSFSIFV